MAQRYSAAVDACSEVLPEFADHNRLPTRDGKLLPCMLTGTQVGAVQLILWKARKLDRQNQKLRAIVCGLRKEIQRLQLSVDSSITYLDPDRQ